MGSSKDKEILDCGETLDVGTVAVVHQKAQEFLGRDWDPEGTLRVDLSKVSQFDTAGVQLLWALSAAAEDSSLGIVFEEPSEALCKAVEVLGIGCHLSGWPGWPGQQANEIGE